MKYLFIYFFTMLSSICWGQELRLDIKEVVDEIAKSNSITSEFIYYVGVKSEQFERFISLDSLASDKELEYLITHKSPAVRCAAFSSFCKRKPLESQEYLTKAIYDQETVSAQYGCIGSSRKVGDVFLESFYFSLSRLDSSEWLIIQPKMVKLDSLILHDTKIKLEYKSGRIKDLEPNSSNYELIRELASNKAEPYAVITLAKYRNERDKQIIIDWLEDEENQYFGIWAAREFPDATFFPYLMKIFKKEWRDRSYSYTLWRVLYQALAQYPDNLETIEVFDKTIKAKNKFRRETLSRYLLIAVTKYPNSKFMVYKNKIKVTGIHAEFLEEEMNVEN